HPLPLSAPATDFLSRAAGYHDRRRRSNRRRVGAVIGGLAVGLLAVAGLSVFAFAQKAEADGHRRAAEQALGDRDAALADAHAARNAAVESARRATENERLATDRLARIEKVVGPAVHEATLPQMAAAMDLI